MDPDLEDLVQEAIIDLQAVGRFWLSGINSVKIEEEVIERLPGLDIIGMEPDPYDEHVLVDATQGLDVAKIEKIARKRHELRERDVPKNKLPK